MPGSLEITMSVSKQQFDYEVLMHRFYKIACQSIGETQFLKQFLFLLSKYFKALAGCIVQYDRVQDKFMLRVRKGSLPEIWDKDYWIKARERKYKDSSHRSVVWPILLCYEHKAVKKEFLWGMIALYHENAPFKFDDYSLLRTLSLMCARELKRRTSIQLDQIRNHLARKVTSEQDPINLCYQIIHHIGRFIKYDHSATLLTVDPDIPSATIVAETIRGSAEKNPNIGKDFPLSDNLVQFLTNSKGALLLSRKRKDTNARIFIQDKEGVKEDKSGLGKSEIYELAQVLILQGERFTGSLIICPLQENEGVVGLLQVVSRRPEAYELPEIEKILSITEYASKVLLRVKSIEAELSILKELENSLQWGKGIETLSQPYKAILQLLVTKMNRLLKADISVLIPYQAREGKFESEMMVTDSTVPSRISDYVLRGDIIKKEEVISHGEHEWRDGNKSFYGVTLKTQNPETAEDVKGEIVGILLVEFEKFGEFEKSGISDREKDTIKNFGSFAAHIINNRRQHQGRIQELKILQKINAIIGREKNIEGLLKLIFDEGFRLVNADAGCIAVPDPKEGNLKIIASYRLKPGKEGATIKYGEGVTGYSALHKRPVVIEDENKPPPGIKPLPWVANAHCEFATPLIWEGPTEQHSQLLGVLSMERSITPSKFSKDEIRSLERLATQAVLAIRRAKERQNLEALLKVGREITISHKETHIFEILLKQGMEQTGAYAASARVLDETRQFLEVKARDGDIGILRDKTIRVGDGVNGWVAKHHKTCLLSDVKAEEENIKKYPGLKYLPSHKDTRSELGVPLIWETKCVGVINFEHKDIGGLDNEVRFIKGLASQAAIELHNLHQQCREMELKDFDILRGLATQAAFLGHNMSGFFVRILNHLNEYIEKNEDWRLSEIKKEAVGALRQVDALSELVPNEEVRHKIRISVNHLLEEISKKLKVPENIALELKFNQFPSNLCIKGNMIQLGYVITQLVDNACRELPSYIADGNIIISALRSENEIIISVEDNGPGIDGDRQKELFDFIKSKSFETKGRGVGLFLCRSIIENHTGKIEVESEKGVGSKFLISLPLEEEV